MDSFTFMFIMGTCTELLFRPSERQGSKQIWTQSKFCPAEREREIAGKQMFFQVKYCCVKKNSGINKCTKGGNKMISDQISGITLIRGRFYCLQLQYKELAKLKYE